MTIKEKKIAKVKELYSEGIKPAQIARIVKVTAPTITAWLKDEGVYRYDHYTKMETVEAIRQMYLVEGMTTLQIATELNMKQSKIRNILTQYDIHRTKNGKAIYKATDVELHKEDDPIFYVAHTPSNEKVEYGGKKYKDVSAIYLG